MRWKKFLTSWGKRSLNCASRVTMLPLRSQMHRPQGWCRESSWVARLQQSVSKFEFTSSTKVAIKKDQFDAYISARDLHVHDRSGAGLEPVLEVRQLLDREVLVDELEVDHFERDLDVLQRLRRCLRGHLDDLVVHVAEVGLDRVKRAHYFLKTNFIMNYSNQFLPLARPPAQIKKVEFRSIEKGLEKNGAESCDKLPLPARPLRYLLIKTNTDFKRSEPTLQPMSNDDKEKKFEMLRKQPPTFFQKIPKIPLTMMNSTRRNKEIQMRLLAKSKLRVKEHQIDKSIQQIPAQDNAIRELIDTYSGQFTFKSAMDQKKKHQVDELKEKYLKTFFIKNQNQIFKKSAHTTGSKLLQNTDEQDQTRGIHTKMSELSEHKKRNFTLQTLSLLEATSLPCTGYCTFIKELMKRNKNSVQSCYITQD